MKLSALLLIFAVTSAQAKLLEVGPVISPPSGSPFQVLAFTAPSPLIGNCIEGNGEGLFRFTFAKDFISDQDQTGTYQPGDIGKSVSKYFCHVPVFSRHQVEQLANGASAARVFFTSHEQGANTIFTPHPASGSRISVEIDGKTVSAQLTVNALDPVTPYPGVFPGLDGDYLRIGAFFPDPENVFFVGIQVACEVATYHESTDPAVHEKVCSKENIMNAAARIAPAPGEARFEVSALLNFEIPVPGPYRETLPVNWKSNLKEPSEAVLKELFD